MHQEAEAKGSN